MHISSAAAGEQDRLAKDMLLFMIPVILGNLLQIMFTTADAIIVGRFVGADALAAVGSTTALVNMIVNFFIGLTMGVTVMAAKSYAAGDREDLHGYVHTSVAFALLFGFTGAAIVIYLRRGLLAWLAVPDAIFDQASIYLRVYLLGLPAISLYNTGAAILRSYGDSRRPMLFLTIAGIVNVTLKIGAVVLKLGITGIAFATTVANYTSAILTIVSLIRLKEGWKRLNPAQLRIQKRSLKRILAIGLPSAIHSSMFGFANIMIASAINSLGTVVIAGNAAAVSIESICYTALSGMCTTIITFYSQTTGTRRWSQTRRVCLVGTAIGYAIFMAFAIPSYIFIRPFLSIYNSDPAVIAAGVQRINFMLLPLVLELPMDGYSHAMRALGHSIPPMVISIGAICAFRVIWMLFVFPHFMTYSCVLITWPISWILADICYVLVHPRIRRKYPTEDLCY